MKVNLIKSLRFIKIMGSICPQCNHLFTKLANLAVISGCTPPMEGEKYCVKCGTKLIDENLEAIVTCPKCNSPRRKKPLEVNFGVHSTIDPNANYVRFCGECGHDFESDS